jgi:ceramide synthetase
LIAWILSRLIYFPFWVLWTIYYDADKYVPFARGIPFFYHKIVFLIFLGSLLLMHFYWSFLLGKIVHNFVIKGEAPSDIRESSGKIKRKPKKID